MPRRRLLDPSFWDDHYIANLSRDERLFVLGCTGNADDEGRLKAHPAYLKAGVFMYDNDVDTPQVGKLKESCLGRMETWPKNHPYRMVSYQNAGEDYLHFPSWYEIQKPSHPTKSKLPPPPESLPIFSGKTPETIEQQSGEEPEGRTKASALGQSRSEKVRLGQVRGVQADFTKFLDSETDLTDFLTTTLTENISAGRAQMLAAEGGLGGGGPGELSPEQEATVRMRWGIPILQKCWTDGVGEPMPTAIFDGARKALRNYDPGVMAKAFAKGVRYKGGKHKSWKYVQTIIDEEMEKHGRSPPHS